MPLFRYVICFLCGYSFRALQTSLRSTINVATTAATAPPEAQVAVVALSNQSEKLAVVAAAVDMPLFALPLIKELRAGWGSKEIPTVLYKNATGTRSLVVDVGLDEAKEFFFAMEQGFEVVGLEPNPIAFEKAAKKCREMSNIPCIVLKDLKSLTWPLQRKPGTSYLILAAVGQQEGTLPFYNKGEMGTFSPPDRWKRKHPPIMVPVLRLDQVIQEDVYLLKIDTQGFDHYVLAGSSGLFENFIVRQVLFEVDPVLLQRNNVDMMETITMVQRQYGMLCFTARNDALGNCQHLSDTADAFVKRFSVKKETSATTMRFYSECWDDMLCLNVRKAYTGSGLPYTQV